MKSTRTLIASALLLAASLASAQMPAALRDANAPAAGDWAKASTILRNNLIVYGFGGLLVPFFGIKLIDMALVVLRLV